ncbi:MAG TPA: DNA-3-methyladenine glycosylase I [Acidimicrobiaceae bacterium]|nr:DNA-3-methyladenine glycosylase I [Acidimicrobiaceae bacterium]HCB37274.1 DNA-3-methyladenine glycosylase I [Acidimicrobiaceae bacterium]
MPDGLVERADGTVVCWWGEGHADYAAYHDTEWGVPVASDVGLFERMCLEGFQSGLSWLTVLRKRANFRAAFAGFDPAAVARFGDADVARLLGDAGIIRHRGKIEATIANAAAALAMIERHGSLAAVFRGFEPPAAARPANLDRAVLTALARTPESTALSTALRAAGWRFVGPTTCYALMQAAGIVNDHLDGCFRRPEVERLRELERPREQARD